MVSPAKKTTPQGFSTGIEANAAVPSDCMTEPSPTLGRAVFYTTKVVNSPVLASQRNMPNGLAKRDDLENLMDDLTASFQNSLILSADTSDEVKEEVVKQVENESLGLIHVIAVHSKTKQTVQVRRSARLLQA